MTFYCSTITMTCHPWIPNGGIQHMDSILGVIGLELIARSVSVGGLTALVAQGRFGEGLRLLWSTQRNQNHSADLFLDH